MRIDICTRDSVFRVGCQTALVTWMQALGAETEIHFMENIEGGEQDKTSLLFLDVDSFEPKELKSLGLLRSAWDALFVCSGNPKSAIQCYQFRPTAFLGKPFSAAMLDNAMSRCVSLWQEKLRSLELTENRSRLKIHQCDILWASAMGRSCMLHCMRRDVKIGESMNELVGILPGDCFIRCQRSFLVNLYHVKATDGKMLYMTDGTTVSIGRGIQGDVLEALQRFQERWNCFEAAVPAELI